MEVDSIEVTKEEAKQELEALKYLFKTNRSIQQAKIYKDMQSVYGHINRHGGKIIDVFEVLKAFGLDDEGNPKIAICRADAEKCFLYRNSNGSAIFANGEAFNRWTTPRKTFGDIEVPQNTFEWHIRDEKEGRNSWNLKTKTVQTILPLIPAKILIDAVKFNLKNYYILWEVEEWNPVPVPPRDPLLLKKLTPNLFGVLATWNLTEIERAILKSHLVN